jgi:hypothetical protein
MGSTASPSGPLEEVVRALQRENEGLREALRTRAVIEQAKGILMERRTCSPDEAFAEIRRISQRENARLADVAATLVGFAAPSLRGDGPTLPEDVLPPQARLSGRASEAWRTLREWPGVRATAVDAIVQSLASAAEDGDEGAGLLADLSGADGVTLLALREDHSLEIIGAHGYPKAAASAWRRIPMALEVPVTRAVRTGQAYFFASEEQMVAEFPAMRGALGDFVAAAVLPLHRDGSVAGALLLNWRAEHPFPDEEVDRIAHAVRRPGVMLLGALPGRDPNPSLLRELLTLNPDPWMVLGLAPGSPAQAAHLVIESASADLPRRLEGVRLLAAFPGLADQPEVCEHLVRVVHDDRVLLRRIDTPGPAGTPWDRAPGMLRAVQSGGRIVLTWRAQAPVAGSPAE